jgi:teichuronic acid biosynthesis protein TuaE
VPAALTSRGPALRGGLLTAAWTVLGALLALALGVIAVGSPIVALGAAAGLLFVGLVLNVPSTVLTVALLVLAISPEYLGAKAGVLDRPELQKALLYAALVPMALVRGMRPSLSLPLIAYPVAAVLSVLFGKLAPGLSVGQMLSSFLTLAVGWFALSIRWDPVRDVRFLKAVALLPVASLVFGVLLDGAGIHALVLHSSGVVRLQGASIAAQLALTAFISTVTAYVLYRQFAWRPAPLLLVVDALILIATVSRGAMIALALVMAIPLVRFLAEPLVRAPRVAVARTGIALVVGIGLVVAFGPKVAARTDKGYYIVGQGFKADKTSGRSEAWKEFYAIAKKSPLFGHGVGAGPITKIRQEGFKAQHNEYLRFYLENGYVGGILILLSIVAVIARAIRMAPRRIRVDLAITALAIAVFSATDNTLTSVNLTLPLGLLLGVCANVGRTPAAPGFTRSRHA